MPTSNQPPNPIYSAPQISGIHSLSASLTGVQPAGALTQTLITLLPASRSPPRNPCSREQPGAPPLETPHTALLGESDMDPRQVSPGLPPCNCSHFLESSSSLTSEPLQAPCSPLRKPLSFDPSHPALTPCSVIPTPWALSSTRQEALQDSHGGCFVHQRCFGLAQLKYRTGWTHTRRERRVSGQECECQAPTQMKPYFKKESNQQLRISLEPNDQSSQVNVLPLVKLQFCPLIYPHSK